MNTKLYTKVFLKLAKELLVTNIQLHVADLFGLGKAILINFQGI